MFGRFTDAFKSKEKTDIWREAVNSFEKKNYFDSIRFFVKYLSDDDTRNIDFSDNVNALEIKFKQGTKLIVAKVDDKKITAESAIAVVTKPGVAFMRRLLELNFGFYYTRFALKDGMIILRFDSSIMDCSPSKFYYAIKELALNANKHSGLLIKDFSSLQPIIEVNPVIIPENEKNVKYKYYRKWIEESLKTVNSLNEKSFEGGISYLLLSTIYKIDFFLLPEGDLEDELERLSSLYFNNDGKSFLDKNINVKESLQKLYDEPESKVTESFIQTISTFSFLSPADFNSVLNVINDNQKNIKWYIDNKHENLALAIYEYIFGFCLYNYGMEKCLTHLFKLGMFLINYDYYRDFTFGSGSKYFIEEDKLNDKLIIEVINRVIENSKLEYPGLLFNTSNLNFSSLLNFLNSYFKEIQILNYSV